MSADPYVEFLSAKRHSGRHSGLVPRGSVPQLFPFQRDLVNWALDRGRAAILADCGLGKTPMQLAWADEVCEQTNGRALILTPLAVASQTAREAEKFGVDAMVSREGKPGPRITITNYERLHYFDCADFTAVVCDESSILKNFSGARRTEITRFLRHAPYRLLATATAAPNDYIEVGTSSEALGHLGHMDMLNRFFVNDLKNSATGRQWGQVTKWRLKGHAERPFWQWVCSWARALRRPSDLGYDDDGFILPPLRESEHVVEATRPANGMLFALPAASLQEQREERRSTIRERCQRVADLVNDTGKPALVWCHLNAEGDLLERLIRDAVQVKGADTDDKKERGLVAFAAGDARVLVTKPKIGAFGLNFQQCPHVVMFPSHSYEQYYQSIRRCWRYGQTSPVQVDIVTTEGEQRVLGNLRRKAHQAEEMFSRMVEHMHDAITITRTGKHEQPEEVPAWL